LKFFEADKWAHKQQYGLDPKAGRKHVASGRISHRRHEWAGHYGKGISRVPRKTMWRRGTQFFWIATEVSGTRGGRRVHGPIAYPRTRKVNNKEVQIAMNSGFASTAKKDLIVKRYSSLNEKISVSFPIVVESKLDNIKTADLIIMLEKIFPGIDAVFKRREIRQGVGKNRGRKYKTTAGLLLVKAKDEKIVSNVIDVKNANDLCIEDLYPLGRLVVYTEKALNELKGANKSK
jgi:ribosomal protein L4